MTDVATVVVRYLVVVAIAITAKIKGHDYAQTLALIMIWMELDRQGYRRMHR